MDDNNIFINKTYDDSSLDAGKDLDLYSHIADGNNNSSSTIRTNKVNNGKTFNENYYSYQSTDI